MLWRAREPCWRASSQPTPTALPKQRSRCPCPWAEQASSREHPHPRALTLRTLPQPAAEAGRGRQTGRQTDKELQPNSTRDARVQRGGRAARGRRSRGGRKGRGAAASTSGGEGGGSAMAAPMELSCWGGGWGLPSVHTESLIVMVTAGRGLSPPGPRAEGRAGEGERRGGDPAAGSLAGLRQVLGGAAEGERGGPLLERAARYRRGGWGLSARAARP